MSKCDLSKNKRNKNPSSSASGGDSSREEDASLSNPLTRLKEVQVQLTDLCKTHPELKKRVREVALEEPTETPKFRNDRRPPNKLNPVVRLSKQVFENGEIVLSNRAAEKNSEALQNIGVNMRNRAAEESSVKSKSNDKQEARSTTNTSTPSRGGGSGRENRASAVAAGVASSTGQSAAADSQDSSSVGPVLFKFVDSSGKDITKKVSKESSKLSGASSADEGTLFSPVPKESTNHRDLDSSVMGQNSSQTKEINDNKRDVEAEHGLDATTEAVGDVAASANIPSTHPATTCASEVDAASINDSADDTAPTDASAADAKATDSVATDAATTDTDADNGQSDARSSPKPKKSKDARTSSRPNWDEDLGDSDSDSDFSLILEKVEPIPTEERGPATPSVSLTSQMTRDFQLTEEEDESDEDGTEEEDTASQGEPNSQPRRSRINTEEEVLNASLTMTPSQPGESQLSAHSGIKHIENGGAISADDESSECESSLITPNTSRAAAQERSQGSKRKSRTSIKERPMERDTSQESLVTSPVKIALGSVVWVTNSAGDVPWPALVTKDPMHSDDSHAGRGGRPENRSAYCRPRSNESNQPDGLEYHVTYIAKEGDKWVAESNLAKHKTNYDIVKIGTLEDPLAQEICRVLFDPNSLIREQLEAALKGACSASRKNIKERLKFTGKNSRKSGGGGISAPSLRGDKLRRLSSSSNASTPATPQQLAHTANIDKLMGSFSPGDLALSTRLKIETKVRKALNSIAPEEMHVGGKTLSGFKLFQLAWKKANQEIGTESEDDPDFKDECLTKWSNIHPYERKLYKEFRNRLQHESENDSDTNRRQMASLRQQEVKAKKEDEERRKAEMGPGWYYELVPKTPKPGEEETGEDEEPMLLGQFRNERCCVKCEEVASVELGPILRCRGPCQNSYHPKCVNIPKVEEFEKWKCPDCMAGVHFCFLCKHPERLTGDEESEDSWPIGPLRKCTSTGSCGKFYHPTCLTKTPLWPQAVLAGGGASMLVCPAHVCHTCVSDDPRRPVMKTSEKLIKCVRCPTAYHSNDYCVAAGTVQITKTDMICPKHYKPPTKGKKTASHINASWCFMCSKGGSLICCEICPSSFHVECLKITPPEGKYYCDNCETGRMPLYDEIVWVKVGNYRWWPAIVLHPTKVPDNIEKLQHELGEFPIQFLGSNDYYWINQGRAFLYEDGDSERIPAMGGKTTDASFRRGVMDAKRLFKEARDRNDQRMTKNQEKAKNKGSSNHVKPAPYVKLKTNKPFGDCPVVTRTVKNIQRCDCDPNQEAPCGEDSNCINRLLMSECCLQLCPAADRCHNMRFQRREYPNVKVEYVDGRGFGLVADQGIPRGTFVIEYVGELITTNEYKRRMAANQEAKEENYYYLTIDKDRMIDAGPKGNLARFMNHSCDPNCITQKWQVNGDTRVGLFAIKDIEPDTELTFNYQLESVGDIKKKCLCNAANCSGYIGLKPNNKKEEKKRDKQKKSRKRRALAPKPKAIAKEKDDRVWEDVCFRCMEDGTLIKCREGICPKVYHLGCLGISKFPLGKFVCPWHKCHRCQEPVTGPNAWCMHCPNAFCPEHVSCLVNDETVSWICDDHDEELAYLKECMKDNKNGLTEIISCPNPTPEELEAWKKARGLDNSEQSQAVRHRIIRNRFALGMSSSNGNSLASGTPSVASNMSSRSETPIDSVNGERVEEASAPDQLVPTLQDADYTQEASHSSTLEAGSASGSSMAPQTSSQTMMEMEMSNQNADASTEEEMRSRKRSASCSASDAAPTPKRATVKTIRKSQDKKEEMFSCGMPGCPYVLINIVDINLHMDAKHRKMRQPAQLMLRIPTRSGEVNSVSVADTFSWIQKCSRQPRCPAILFANAAAEMNKVIEAHFASKHKKTKAVASKRNSAATNEDDIPVTQGNITPKVHGITPLNLSSARGRQNTPPPPEEPLNGDHLLMEADDYNNIEMRAEGDLPSPVTTPVSNHTNNSQHHISNNIGASPLQEARSMNMVNPEVRNGSSSVNPANGSTNDVSSPANEEDIRRRFVIEEEVVWKCSVDGCRFLGTDQPAKMQLHLRCHNMPEAEINRLAANVLYLTQNMRMAKRTLYRFAAAAQNGGGPSPSAALSRDIKPPVIASGPQTFVNGEPVDPLSTGFSCLADQEICGMKFESEMVLLKHLLRVHLIQPAVSNGSGSAAYPAKFEAALRGQAGPSYPSHPDHMSPVQDVPTRNHSVDHLTGGNHHALASSTPVLGGLSSAHRDLGQDESMNSSLNNTNLATPNKANESSRYEDHPMASSSASPFHKNDQDSFRTPPPAAAPRGRAERRSSDKKRGAQSADASHKKNAEAASKRHQSASMARQQNMSASRSQVTESPLVKPRQQQMDADKGGKIKMEQMDALEMTGPFRCGLCPPNESPLLVDQTEIFVHVRAAHLTNPDGTWQDRESFCLPEATVEHAPTGRLFLMVSLFRIVLQCGAEHCSMFVGTNHTTVEVPASRLKMHWILVHTVDSLREGYSQRDFCYNNVSVDHNGPAKPAGVVDDCLSFDEQILGYGVWSAGRNRAAFPDPQQSRASKRPRSRTASSAAPRTASISSESSATAASPAPVSGQETADEDNGIASGIKEQRIVPRVPNKIAGVLYEGPFDCVASGCKFQSDSFDTLPRHYNRNHCEDGANAAYLDVFSGQVVTVYDGFLAIIQCKLCCAIACSNVNSSEAVSGMMRHLRTEHPESYKSDYIPELFEVLKDEKGRHVSDNETSNLDVSLASQRRGSSSTPHRAQSGKDDAANDDVLSGGTAAIPKRRRIVDDYERVSYQLLKTQGLINNGRELDKYEGPFTCCVEIVKNRQKSQCGERLQSKRQVISHWNEVHAAKGKKYTPIVDFSVIDKASDKKLTVHDLNKCLGVCPRLKKDGGCGHLVTCSSTYENLQKMVVQHMSKVHSVKASNSVDFTVVLPPAPKQAIIEEAIVTNGAKAAVKKDAVAASDLLPFSSADAVEDSVVKAMNISDPNLSQNQSIQEEVEEDIEYDGPFTCNRCDFEVALNHTVGKKILDHWFKHHKNVAALSVKDRPSGDDLILTNFYSNVAKCKLCDLFLTSNFSQRHMRDNVQKHYRQKHSDADHGLGPSFTDRIIVFVKDNEMIAPRKVVEKKQIKNAVAAKGAAAPTNVAAEPANGDAEGSAVDISPAKDDAIEEVPANSGEEKRSRKKNLGRLFYGPVTCALTKKSEAGVTSVCGHSVDLVNRMWKMAAVNHFIAQHSELNIDEMRIADQGAPGHPVYAIQDIFMCVGQCDETDCFMIRGMNGCSAASGRYDLRRFMIRHFRIMHPGRNMSYSILVDDHEIKFATESEVVVKSEERSPSPYDQPRLPALPYTPEASSAVKDHSSSAKKSSTKKKMKKSGRSVSSDQGSGRKSLADGVKNIDDSTSKSELKRSRSQSDMQGTESANTSLTSPKKKVAKLEQHPAKQHQLESPAAGTSKLNETSVLDNKRKRKSVIVKLTTDGDNARPSSSTPLVDANEDPSHQLSPPTLYTADAFRCWLCLHDNVRTSRLTCPAEVEAHLNSARHKENFHTATFAPVYGSVAAENRIDIGCHAGLGFFFKKMGRCTICGLIMGTRFEKNFPHPPPPSTGLLPEQDQKFMPRMRTHYNDAHKQNHGGEEFTPRAVKYVNESHMYLSVPSQSVGREPPPAPVDGAGTSESAPVPLSELPSGPDNRPRRSLTLNPQAAPSPSSSIDQPNLNVSFGNNMPGEAKLKKKGRRRKTIGDPSTSRPNGGSDRKKSLGILAKKRSSVGGLVKKSTVGRRSTIGSAPRDPNVPVRDYQCLACKVVVRTGSPLVLLYKHWISTHCSEDQRALLFTCVGADQEMAPKKYVTLRDVYSHVHRCEAPRLKGGACRKISGSNTNDEECIRIMRIHWQSKHTSMEPSLLKFTPLSHVGYACRLCPIRNSEVLKDAAQVAAHIAKNHADLPAKDIKLVSLETGVEGGFDDVFPYVDSCQISGCSHMVYDIRKQIVDDAMEDHMLDAHPGHVNEAPAEDKLVDHNLGQSADRASTSITKTVADSPKPIFAKKTAPAVNEAPNASQNDESNGSSNEIDGFKCGIPHCNEQYLTAPRTSTSAALAKLKVHFLAKHSDLPIEKFTSILITKDGRHTASHEPGPSGSSDLESSVIQGFVYKCPGTTNAECSEQSTHYVKLEKHWKSKHEKPGCPPFSPLRIDIQAATIFKCEHCDYGNISMEAVKDHASKEHPQVAERGRKMTRRSEMMATAESPSSAPASRKSRSLSSQKWILAPGARTRSKEKGSRSPAQKRRRN